MAASLTVEQESGTYTARIRHPHNGYYAGDFSQSSRLGSEPHVSVPPVPHRAQDRSRPPDPGHLAGATNLVRIHARQQ